MIRDRRRIEALMERLPGTSSSTALPPSPPDAPEWRSSWGVPRVLTVMCQLPYKAGHVLGAHPEDDAGLSIPAYFVLSRRSCELLEKGTLTPSLRLWRRFVEAGESTKDGAALKVV